MKKITFTKEELSQNLVLEKIENEISKSKNNVSEKDKELIIKHTYAQIEIVVDKLMGGANSLFREPTLPKYEVDKDGFIIFEDKVLKNSRLKYSKESVLNFINELCISAPRYAMKGIAYGKRN